MSNKISLDKLNELREEGKGKRDRLKKLAMDPQDKREDRAYYDGWDEALKRVISELE